MSDGPSGGRRAPVLATVSLLSSLSFVGLSTITLGNQSWLAVALVLLAGLSAASWHGVMNASAPELASPGLSATSVGLTATVARLGYLSLPPLFGFLATATGGNYQIPWLACALITAAGTLVLLLVRKRKVVSRARRRTGHCWGLSIPSATAPAGAPSPSNPNPHPSVPIAKGGGQYSPGDTADPGWELCPRHPRGCQQISLPPDGGGCSVE